MIRVARNDTVFIEKSMLRLCKRNTVFMLVDKIFDLIQFEIRFDHGVSVAPVWLFSLIGVTASCIYVPITISRD
jgi:hypothetical protein